MPTEPRPEGPYVLSGDAERASVVEEAKPAFLDLAERLHHTIRVVAIDDGYGACDYYVVCACGWVSDPCSRHGAFETCGIERAVRYGLRGLSNYKTAQVRAAGRGGRNHV